VTGPAAVRGYSGRVLDTAGRLAALDATYAPGGRCGPDRCPPSGRPADPLTPTSSRRPERIPPAVWERMPWAARMRADHRHRPSPAPSTITTTREDAR
jgi:hypothetical protein